MNKILISVASAPLGTISYTAPMMKVIKMSTEGVLCVSGELEGWEEDDLDW
jgi:hypothetical protein